MQQVRLSLLEVIKARDFFVQLAVNLRPKIFTFLFAIFSSTFSLQNFSISNASIDIRHVILLLSSVQQLSLEI